MTISAATVKELRERTGAGVMECKKALTESQGDIDLAVESMRKAGLAKADKKAGRVAAEGCITIELSAAAAAMVEVNCETDFVAHCDAFGDFATAVSRVLLARPPADLEALGRSLLEGSKTVETGRRELVAKLGENISLRRFAVFDATVGVLGVYTHGGRIGVLVEMQGGTPGLARDIAMHVAASKPLYVSPEQVSAEVLQHERQIFHAQCADSGKPAAIIDKMVEGRLRKFLAEVTLLGQPFVKNPDITVEHLLAQSRSRVLRFTRFEVGEGVEKKQEDFAAEVMAQARGV